MPLFAFEEALWLNLAVNVVQLLALVVGLIAWGLGWRRRNGWHPPAERRSGQERRCHPPDRGNVSQAREDETQAGQ